MKKKQIETIYNPLDVDNSIIPDVFDYIFELILTDEDTH